MILIVILSLALSFLLTAGLVWLICWLLPALGVATIGTLTIVFSWKLALLVWLILLLLRSIFSACKKRLIMTFSSMKQLLPKSAQP